MGTAAPERVYRLVENFERSREEYRRPDYNETLVRVNFINPLFEELGWDVNNRRGEAPSDLEVVHEDAVKVGQVHKAPDCEFYANQEWKLIVGTKRHRGQATR